MSLFCVKDWWSTRPGSQEEFSPGGLVVAALDLEGGAKVISGSFSGMLRIYNPTETGYRVDDLLLETSLDDMTDVVVQRFPSAIARDAVSREQVARLIARLAAIARTRIAGIDLRGDLNRCTTEELDAAKDAMNATFLRNAKRPGDEGYEYDRQVEFGAPTEENDWDDSESEDDILTLP